MKRVARVCQRQLSYTCIFDEHLTFSDQITSLSKACYYHIRQLRCTGLTSIPQLPVPLLPLSSLALNYPVSSRSKTLLLVLSLKLPSPVIITPILRSHRWLRINERIEYKLLCH